MPGEKSWNQLVENSIKRRNKSWDSQYEVDKEMKNLEIKYLGDVIS